MKTKITMNLKMFGDKDFFTSAFNEAYNIGNDVEEVVEEVPSDAPESPVSEDNNVEEQIVGEPSETSKELTDDEIKALYEEKFGKMEENVKNPIDENTQSAIELYQYLESNPHLVQAMRDVDVKGYEQLNSLVPDELTRKVQELESFIEEQRYNQYVSGLKQKYSDFDEDKVLEFAEKHDVLDLEVAYKALKAESVKEPNMDEIRKQIREEILAELKQNSLSTQSIVGGVSQKPINSNDEVSLNTKEQRIAKAMGMTPTEYAKWR